MELSVRDAAALLECSPRTLRAQLQRGDIPGMKRQGKWRIDQRALPLNEAQRRRLQAKADDLRQAVEDVLPSRLASSAGQKGRSVADLDAFRRGGEVLRAIRADDGALSEASRDQITAQLETALLALAEAAQQFERTVKLEAIGRSRAGFSRAAALLLLDAGVPAAAAPVHGWVQALENEVLPMVAGFARCPSAPTRASSSRHTSTSPTSTTSSSASSGFLDTSATLTTSSFSRISGGTCLRRAGRSPVGLTLSAVCGSSIRRRVSFPVTATLTRSGIRSLVKACARGHARCAGYGGVLR